MSRAITLPQFSSIDINNIPKTLETLLADNRAEMTQHLATHAEATDWNTAIAPLLELDNRLALFWSPIRHIHSVKATPEIRNAYEACQPMLTAYYTELGQNKAIYDLYLAVQKNDPNLNQSQRQSLAHAIRDFKLSGVHLDEDKKQTMKAIHEAMSELTTQFGNHVLDATDHWFYHCQDKAELAGIPETDIALFAEKASRKDLTGWVIGLDYPSYYAVLTFAENRALREKLYEAFQTRASDQGPDAKQFDNAQIMVEILQNRQKLAALLDFNNYAEYSLATKMADSPDAVIAFLNQLGTQIKPMAEAQFNTLSEFARTLDQTIVLEPWDISFYSEKLRQQSYDFSQEMIKPYLSIDKVLTGMFTIVKKLYAVEIQEEHEFDRWHPDVRLFSLYRNGECIAKFYGDFFAREMKRGGAWMDEYSCRYKNQLGETQLPVAYLTCNFTPKSDNQPSLLTLDEVTTLFHEFGHGLHHMLTAIDTLPVSGINGVLWDAVELPSQFMENWCWQNEALEDFAHHHETQDLIPQDLLDKAIQAKNFQSALMLVRQLEFALFDFKLHQQDLKQIDYQDIHNCLQSVRKQVSVTPQKEYNRFANSFSHIFAGGYAAGYYSYLWAEVLSSDAFSRFEEEGIFNPETGRAFYEHILSQGGSDDPMRLFVAFRGREPSTEALLRHRGITAA